MTHLWGNNIVVPSADKNTWRSSSRHAVVTDHPCVLRAPCRVNTVAVVNEIDGLITGTIARTCDLRLVPTLAAVCCSLLHSKGKKRATSLLERPQRSQILGLVRRSSHGTLRARLVAPNTGLRKRCDDAVHDDGAIHSWSGVRVRRGASYGPTLLDVNEPGRSYGAVAVRADGRVRPA